MFQTLRRAALAFAVLAAAACGGQREEAAPPPPPDSLPVVVLETAMGRIVLELDHARAPRTVDNILRHLAVNFYDGLIFHRVAAGFVVQTGMATPDGMVRTSSAPPVVNEADNGLKNRRGTLGLARFNDPQSGGVQFFINLKDNPELDFRARTAGAWGYAVFGRVTEGMEVVDRIGRARTGTAAGTEETPLEPIIVNRAYVVPRDSTRRPTP
jgi:cyclophilin family peptidyl-prolyl cis-trans isomerase